MDVRYQRIGIAGSGRVARAMALALAPRSAAPVLIWGRSPGRVHEAAATVGGTVAENCADLTASCDLIVIAVADAALAEVAVGLAEALAGTEPFVCHVSGGSGAAILAPLAGRGALTAAVHPAMTFTGDPAQEAGRMAGACFAITATDGEALAEARTLVALLGGVADDRASWAPAPRSPPLCRGPCQGDRPRRAAAAREDRGTDDRALHGRRPRVCDGAAAPLRSTADARDGAESRGEDLRRPRKSLALPSDGGRGRRR